jgi:hypothetical protein
MNYSQFDPWEFFGALLIIALVVGLPLVLFSLADSRQGGDAPSRQPPAQEDPEPDTRARRAGL